MLPRRMEGRVNISARVEYACLAVMQLAAAYETQTPVRIRAIAQTHGIPSRFLVQILLQLKSAGLVASTRGAAGGYRLVKDPSGISLADVMRVVDGNEEGITRSCNRETVQAQVLIRAWNDVARVERNMLESTTFQDLLSQVPSESDLMYYI
jgi:Rrf2 family protein